MPTTQTQFDLESLLNFRPPLVMCVKCMHIFETFRGFSPIGQPDSCSACKVRYVRTENGPSFPEYFKEQMCHLGSDDIMDHCRNLAQIAHDARENPKMYPPMWSLFRALTIAKRFVHFTSFKISDLMIGALKLASMRIPVRGIVSGVDNAFTLGELSPDKRRETSHFVVHAYKGNWDKMPHQKLLVVDGLIAFKGSANLTTAGWRKAAEGRDVIEISTNVSEVVTLHNKFFSPIWAEISEIQDSIAMQWEPPDWF